MKDCRQKNQEDSSKTNTTNNETKANNEKSLVKYEGKKMANTACALIQNLISDMEKEEKDKLFENILDVMIFPNRPVGYPR